MQTISLHGVVGEDGMLRLEVPFGARGEEVEVVVVVQEANGHSSANSGWVDASYGICADDPIERPEQGEWGAREEMA